MRTPSLLRIATFSAASCAVAVGQPYKFRSVRINGGGFVTATIFNRAVQGLTYARTDMGGAYRMNSTDGTWIALQDDLGWGNQTYWGTLAMASDAVEPNRVYLACGMYYGQNQPDAAVLYSEQYGNVGTWSAVPLPGVRLGGNEDGRSAGERLAIHPTNNSVLFLGTSLNGMYWSQDKGVSWGPVSGWPTASWAQALMFVLPHGPSGLIFAGVKTAGTDSLQWSADGGQTWSSVPGTPSSLIPYRGAFDAGTTTILADSRRDPGNSQGRPGHVDASAVVTLYLTYSDQVGPNGMSTGKVWKVRLEPSSQAHNGFRADSHATSVTSKANGYTATWTDITPTQGTGGGFAGIATDAQRPGVVMVTTMDRWGPYDEIYRSIDGGTTWMGLVGTAKTVFTDSPWVTFHHNGNQPSWTGWMGDIAIDPFNSSHATHTTGQGLWTSWDVDAADGAGTRSGHDASGVSTTTTAQAPTTWTFTNTGLEQTVPLELVSPPTGPPLVSSIGDVDGFRHDDLDVSPVQGMFNPSWGTGNGLDVAWLRPSLWVRTHALGYGTNNTIHGSYSSDGAYTWTLFPSQPPGAGQEAIVVSADGRSIVWHGHYSTDNGTSWSACGGGLPTGATPVADRVNPAYMYAYDPSGQIWVSTDSGVTFSRGASGLPPSSNFVRATFGHEGHLWLPTAQALYRSTDHGNSFSQVGGPTTVWSVGVGAPLATAQPAEPSRHAAGAATAAVSSSATGSATAAAAYPAVYVHGVINGTAGFWRNGGLGQTARASDAHVSSTASPGAQASSWVRVNSWDSQFGLVMFVIGDTTVPGRMYVATNGRGILVGEPQAGAGDS